MDVFVDFVAAILCTAQVFLVFVAYLLLNFEVMS